MKNTFAIRVLIVFSFLFIRQPLTAQVFYAGKAPARATVSPDKNVLWNNVLEVNFGLIHEQLEHVTFRDKLSSKIIDFDKNSLFALKLNDGTELLPSDFTVSTRDAGTIAASPAAVKIIDRLPGKQLLFGRSNKAHGITIN
jgi:hypothetical protein